MRQNREQNDVERSGLGRSGASQVIGFTACAMEDRVPVIGFGGCGLNLIREFTSYDSAGLGLCVVSESGRHGLAGDSGITACSFDVMDALAEEYAKSPVCFLVGGAGGSSWEYMSSLAGKLQEKGVFVVALCAMPFRFESRSEDAGRSLENLQANAGAVLAFSNDEYAKRQAGEPLGVALSAISQEMFACILAMASLPDSTIFIDSADLRNCLHGFVRHAIGRSKIGLGEAAKEAFCQFSDMNAATRSRQAKYALIGLLEPAGTQSLAGNSLDLMQARANILTGAEVWLCGGSSRSADWIVVVLASYEIEGR